MLVKLKYYYFTYILAFLIFLSSKMSAQNFDSITSKYKVSYDEISKLIEKNGSFKTAVFLAESTFGKYISKTAYLNYISALTELANWYKLHSYGRHYNYSDSINYLSNRSIFSTICDTLTIKSNSFNKILYPFEYNFEDPIGKKDWSNMFVTKLLTTQKGNCRSFAYLYKILADELGVKCWLALAPNHIYIRNHSRKTGWYNTELTSATFPSDAWIATTSYVSTDAIRSGIYMDTLSNQQSIALCVLDLAKGYEFQTHNYYDGFILKCCNLVLQYHPVNPMALLLKAETLKKVYFKQTEEKYPEAKATYEEMEKTYITLAKLHYREMPEKMYQAWLNSLTQQSKKYPTKQAVKQPVQK